MQCIKNKNELTRMVLSIHASLLLLLFLLIPIQALSAPAYDSVIKQITVKKNLVINKSYSATVIVKNTGSQTWSAARGVALSFSSATSRSLGLPSSVSLSTRDQIKPGQSKTFKFNVTAPAKTGQYMLQAIMSQNGNKFGAKSQENDLVVETQVNRVKFISQLLPETMETGKKYTIVVQYKNTGRAIWDRSRGYKLGLRASHKVWDRSRIKLDKSSVATTGDLATFRFELKAPNKPGVYPIQWQMLKGKRWFGEKTPMQHITVKESNASSSVEFVYQDIPGLQEIGKPFTIFERGEVYSVSLTFKNTSDESWESGRFSLNAQNPANLLTWSVDRVDLKSNERIAPGNFKTFAFNIMAPLKPGIYNFQWQMVKGFNTWTGEKSENVSITVK